LLCFHDSYPSRSDDEEPPAAAPPTPPAAIDEPVEPSVVPRPTRSGIKKVPQSRYPTRAKRAKEADISLEAHAPVVSSDDVSNSSLLSPCFFPCHVLLF
jgi:hypothetical protein